MNKQRSWEVAEYIGAVSQKAGGAQSQGLIQWYYKNQFSCSEGEGDPPHTNMLSPPPCHWTELKQ